MLLGVVGALLDQWKGGDRLGNVNVLIAEEQSGVARLLEILMKQRGYRTRIAGTGCQAIRLAKDSAPDIILVDAMMSVENGPALMKELRDDPLTAHIPLVVLTTAETVHELPDDQLAYVTKPFEPHSLSQLVDEVLLSHAQTV
jgi:CheY-like chemotaxis protein